MKAVVQTIFTITPPNENKLQLQTEGPSSQPTSIQEQIIEQPTEPLEID